MASRSVQNNNPGNLRFSPFTERYGAIESKGYSMFPTVAQGTACMVALLASGGYRWLTLPEAITRYAPSEDNNKPREYAAYVAHRAGVSPDLRIADMDPFQILRVAEAMIRFEGWQP